MCNILVHMGVKSSVTSIPPGCTEDGLYTFLFIIIISKGTSHGRHAVRVYVLLYTRLVTPRICVCIYKELTIEPKCLCEMYFNVI